MAFNGPIPPGVRIYADACIPERQERHRQERKWAHRVMWRRGQRFKIETGPVIIVIAGAWYAHPSTIELLQKNIPAPHEVNV
ncbi:hypothetical protein [Pseudomonas lurida]|uniref:hypothetical protein n=1 Tax=Pseudomonas lurida TaxID=244566 RepID=UPI00177E4ED2|nr:hypothetical protein [Pseudomonas lurida]MBD8671573.1 hypothetical protein [Pseudomonas lurida]